MNAYLASVIENVKSKYANEPEFVQTVEEVFSSLEPVIERHPEYEKSGPFEPDGGAGANVYLPRGVDGG